MYELKNWDEKIQKLYEAYAKLGEERLKFEKSVCTATEDEISAVEEKLSVRIPPSFKKCLMEYTKGLDFYARIPDDFELPYELRKLFSARFSWNLDALSEMWKDYEHWLEVCFTNPEDEYDNVWYNKLPFMPVPNGDYIAFDLNDTNEDKRVVYLSHDDGEGHGYILGENFGDYIEKLIAIGASGNEDYQMLPFIEDETSGIDPNCENAQKYRQLIGI